LSLICDHVGSSAMPAARTRGEDGDTSGASRGFVGFINQQDLPWEEFRVKGVASGLKAKTLSRDPKTGAVLLLLSYPPGWRSRADSNYHSSEEEIFVLEGDLTIGGRTLTDRCYSFIPAGVAHGPISTRNGCLALTFFDEPWALATLARNRKRRRRCSSRCCGGVKRTARRDGTGAGLPALPGSTGGRPPPWQKAPH